MLKKFFREWTKFELGLLLASVLAIALSFFLTQEKDFLSLFSSLFGVIGVLFIAKGLIAGQFLCLIFVFLYTALSFKNEYFGECILSLGFMFPSTIIAAITWIKNPSHTSGKVKVNRIAAVEWAFLLFGVTLLGVGGYFLLRALQTAELLTSTVSFITSACAAYLLIRRSAYYAVFYIINDVILIVLWSLAFAKGAQVLPSIISYCAFLLNDAYGFFDWRKRSKLQEKEKSE